MPDSAIRVAADFNDDSIDIPDIPIDPSTPPPSPSPAVEVYFKVLDGTAPISIATVRLYSPSNNLIWQGTTNSQGYVQLDPTYTYYTEDGMKITAQKADKTGEIVVNKADFVADSNNEIWFTIKINNIQSGGSGGTN